MRPENHAPGADAAPLLEVENLAVAFSTMNGPVQAVHEASQRHGDAVDFGRVGFSDENEFQS